MRGRRPFYHILIFVVAQLAWLSLLGLWIYWYVSNYLIFSEVGDKISPQIISEGRNVFTLVGGLILLVALSVAMFLLFHRLNTQFNLTHLYDNFIASVTHELKSPLASIQLFLETMQSHKLSGSKQKEFIASMLMDADRLNKLINAILEIPRLERKKIAHHFEVHSIDSLIHELVKESIVQFNLLEESVHIHGSVSCRCVVDRDALKIVIDNLLDNAIKYSVDPVRISMSLTESSKMFIIEFMDEGIGISPKNQKMVFNKFFRIYNQDIPSVKGTGLGLYWVQQIIRYHGGKIQVSSKGENKGSIFRVELPIYKTTKKRFIKNLLRRTYKNISVKDTPDGTNVEK